MSNNIIMPSTTWNGYSVMSDDTKPVKTPAGLLVTRAVETKAGWVGQIILDKNIVWESKEAHEKEEKALTEVNGRVVERLAKVFA